MGSNLTPLTPSHLQEWLDGAQDAVDLCRYPGARWRIWAEHGRPMLQMQMLDGTCNDTGEPQVWKSRKWLLSVHMTKSELIATAFKALITAMEHETREKFTYRGERVYSPHYDVDVLVAARRTNLADEIRT